MSFQSLFKLEEMPLQGDRRAKLFQALEDHPSYYELSLEISQLADELSKHKKQRVEKARGLIENDRWHKRSMLTMLHTIPKSLLRSIILNTVAYDFLHNPRNAPEHYSADGPGTYVAAMSIAGRSGLFLCAAEMVDLMEGLTRYCEAYERQKVHQGNPITAGDKALDKFARDVDSTFGSRPLREANQLKFIKNEEALQKVKWLIANFDDRSRPTRNQGSASCTFQKQCPLMVGCSNKIQERMPHHDPRGPSGLNLTTYTWGLTLCMIKYQLMLEPLAIVKPVVQTWENNLLATSEVLVTALAGSYVFQEGFNVIGAGGREGDRPDHVLEAAKQHVFFTKPFFCQNIDATIQELERRTTYIENVESISDFITTDIEASLVKIRAELNLAKAAAVQLDAVKTEAQAKLAQMTERRIALQHQVDRLEDVRSIFALFKRHIAPKNDEPLSEM